MSWTIKGNQKGIGFTFGSDSKKRFRMDQIKTQKIFYQQQDYFEKIPLFQL